MTRGDTEDAEATPPAAGTSAVRLRRNWGFQTLWSSQAASSFGVEMTQVAYPLLTLAITGSATYAGVVGAVQMLVFTLTSAPAGVLADVYDRRRLLIASNLARAFVLAFLAVVTLTGHVTIWLIMVTAAASAVFAAAQSPAADAAIKQLVPPEQLGAAASQNQVRTYAVGLAGPPAGGWLFGLDRAFPFVANVVAHLVAAVILLAYRWPIPERRPRERGAASWRGVSAGLRFIAGQPILRALLAWTVGINTAFAGVFIALIATAESRGASSSQIGLMISMVFGGGLIGALAAGFLLKHWRPSHLTIAVAWLAPVVLGVLAVMPGVLLLGVLLGAYAALLPSVNALFASYLAAIVPDSLQGRVHGGVTLLATAASPIGLLGVGLIFDLTGPTWMFLFMAAIAGLAAMPTLTRQVRQLPRPEEVAVE